LERQNNVKGILNSPKLF